MRRRRLAALVSLLLGILLVLAGPASAATPVSALPGVGDCKDAPTPSMPGRGLVGWLQPAPATSPTGTTRYDQYGVAGSVSTYDLGCGGVARDPAAGMDTMIGGWFFGAAKFVVAGTNALHRFVTPPTFLGSLDTLVRTATEAVSSHLYGPWLPTSLVLLAMALLYRARSGEFSGALSMVAWALLVMTGTALAVHYPVEAGHVADATVTAAVSDVNTGLQPAAAGVDPRASLLTDSVLYPAWVRAELGDPASAAAQRYGPALFDAQHYTWAEAKTIKADPQAASGITDRKQAAFKDVASKVQAEDPDAYGYLTGHAGGRASSGLLALVASLLTTLFASVADLLVIVALIIVRLAVIFLPALAVVGLHARTAGLVRGAATAVGAALINSVVFSVGAGVQILIVGVLLAPSTGLPQWAALLICGVLSVVLWAFLKPFRRLTTMVAPSFADGASALGNGGRKASRGVRGLATKFGASYVGGAVAAEVVADRVAGHHDDSAAEAARGGTYTTPPEAWSRPARPTAESPSLPWAGSAPQPATPVVRVPSSRVAEPEAEPDKSAAVPATTFLPAVVSPSPRAPVLDPDRTQEAADDSPATEERGSAPVAISGRPRRADPQWRQGRYSYQIFVPGEGLVEVAGEQPSLATEEESRA